MRIFLVTDVSTRRTTITDAADAARVCGVSTDELEYILGEDGVCETDKHTVVDISIGANGCAL